MELNTQTLAPQPGTQLTEPVVYCNYQLNLVNYQQFFVVLLFLLVEELIVMNASSKQKLQVFQSFLHTVPNYCNVSIIALVEN